MTTFQKNEDLLTNGLVKLLRIKDSDIRITTLRQGNNAVDRGIHIGGAFSAIIPMVSVYYGGYLNLDIQDPTRIGQDMFLLSKGHAVAAMASIHADLGYFPPEILENSRSLESILNGHPGPILPGTQVATGPLGQGVALAQGFAMAGKWSPSFDVYCVTGDGELQEGVVWEAIMHAPQAKLDNLCMIVDKNEGQLDNSVQLIFSMTNLPEQIRAFGWRVFEVDGTSYSSVLEALNGFAGLPRDGKPTAIVCNTKKGYGSFSKGLNLHKVTLSQVVFEQETSLQEAQRLSRISEYLEFEDSLEKAGKAEVLSELRARAQSMGLKLKMGRSAQEKTDGGASAGRFVRSGRVPERDKKIRYNSELLSSYPSDAKVAANDVIRQAMTVFALDSRVVSVDSDLGSTSGLDSGVGSVDKQRGINIGIAESNMMCVGEAFAALGYNAWVSTFCPFFDWKVLRRIAVGAQERHEAMEAPDGWLSPGHGLDLTFLATAANLDTQVNGATHMGNDDILFFSGIPGLNMIDVSCPNQLVGIMRWIMEGGKGLNYVRIMRAASAVLYPENFSFEYAKAYYSLGKGNGEAEVNFVTSGRGVHEAVAAAGLLKARGRKAFVVDMPSFDPLTMKQLLSQRGVTIIAEQNNGYIRQKLGKLLLQGETVLDPSKCLFTNVNNAKGEYHYLHSATYAQLIKKYGLDASQLAETAIKALESKN